MGGSGAEPDPPDRPQLLDALEAARQLGFFGPRPVAEQLAHAEAFATVLADAGVKPCAFLDLGSGGGLPGLVLAARWGASTAVLLDASARRTAFLRKAVDTLGWTGRVTIAEGRAEVLARDPALRQAFPLVVSRSFAAPAVTAEIGGAFLAVGGMLVVSEPVDGTERWPEERLPELGLAPAVIARGERARIALIERVAPVEERWPRGDGVPAKRPLW